MSGPPWARHGFRGWRVCNEVQTSMSALRPIWEQRSYQAAVARARAALGVERLVLAIHDASFPAGDDDLGRGTPYSPAGHRFVRFVQQIGFTGLQLGPQGMTTRGNPSPYDGALFAANVLSLTFGELLPAERLRQLRAGLPAEAAGHAQHRFAYDRAAEALAWLHRAHGERFAADVNSWARRQGAWLERDATFVALAAEHGGDDPRAWPCDLDRRLYARARDEPRAAERRAGALVRHREAVAMFRLGQYLGDQQHAELRRLTEGAGLKLYGDLQIGISARDAWSYRSLLLDDYLMGAPPSRTNPAGQPWAYRVLDPGQYAGGVGAFLRTRVDRMLERYDGLRVDHPHGLICPWVYRSQGGDDHAAVQQGARLFASPDLPDHPRLERFAIVRGEQIDRGARRWDDGWVQELDEEQVDRYGTTFGILAGAMNAHGRAVEDLVCEVLSTWPYPLRRVMSRYGLGRFCVTQKARMDDPRDVYRSENVGPADWIMVGNHDTPPLMRVVAGWQGTAAQEKRAAYLAERLIPAPDERPAFRAWLTESPANMATAMFAELFASPARNVSVFFGDLFGFTEIYNVPGETSEANWSLRVPPDYENRYARQRGAGGALDVPRALALALRADPACAQRHAQLLAELDRLSAPAPTASRL
jgi:4-alpha-glucanotransferase